MKTFDRNHKTGNYDQKLQNKILQPKFQII